MGESLIQYERQIATHRFEWKCFSWVIPRHNGSLRMWKDNIVKCVSRQKKSNVGIIIRV
jgi:hypothetical protein